MKEKPAWVPRDYRHSLADDDLQIGGPDVASLVGRLALASPDRRPKAREVCLDIARRLGASVAKVLDVTPSFLAYATDFDGRGILKRANFCQNTRTGRGRAGEVQGETKGTKIGSWSTLDGAGILRHHLQEGDDESVSNLQSGSQRRVDESPRLGAGIFQACFRESEGRPSVMCGNWLRTVRKIHIFMRSS